MEREEFLQEYGQDALDLFEQYIHSEQPTRIIAMQLKTAYGIYIIPELDEDLPSSSKPER